MGSGFVFQTRLCVCNTLLRSRKKKKKKLNKFLRWTYLTLHFLTGMCLYQSNDHPHGLSFSCCNIRNYFLSLLFRQQRFRFFVIILSVFSWYSWHFEPVWQFFFFFLMNWIVNIVCGTAASDQWLLLCSMWLLCFFMVETLGTLVVFYVLAVLFCQE